MAKILNNTKLKPKKKADLRVVQKPDIKTTKYKIGGKNYEYK